MTNISLYWCKRIVSRDCLIGSHLFYFVGSTKSSKTAGPVNRFPVRFGFPWERPNLFPRICHCLPFLDTWRVSVWCYLDNDFRNHITLNEFGLCWTSELRWLHAKFSADSPSGLAWTWSFVYEKANFYYQLLHWHIVRMLHNLPHMTFPDDISLSRQAKWCQILLLCGRMIRDSQVESKNSTWKECKLISVRLVTK